MKGKNIILISIFIVCILVRLFAGFIVLPKKFPELYDGTRGDTYIQIAQNLVEGEGYVADKHQEYPNLRRPPAYPLFIASILFIFGSENIQAVRIIQTVFDVIICLLIYKLVLVFWEKKPPALLAAGMWAFYYLAVQNNVFFSADSLFALLVTLLVYLLIRLHQNPDKRLSVASGALCGLSVLCKPATQFLPLFIVIFLLWRGRHQLKQWLTMSVIFSFAFLAVIMPWTMRNYIISKHIVVSNAEYGQTLWGGTQQDFDWFGRYWLVRDNKKNIWVKTKFWEIRESREIKEKEVFGKISENRTEPQKYFFNEAINEIINNPGRYAYLCLKRSIAVWYLEISQSKTIRNLFIQLPLMLFSGIGIWKNRRSDILGIFFLLIIYFEMIISVVPTISVRQILPVMPIIFVLASMPVYLGIKRLHNLALNFNFLSSEVKNKKFI